MGETTDTDTWEKRLSIQQGNRKIGRDRETTETERKHTMFQLQQNGTP
jgi:hypothetical protein